MPQACPSLLLTPAGDLGLDSLRWSVAPSWDTSRHCAAWSGFESSTVKHQWRYILHTHTLILIPTHPPTHPHTHTHTLAHKGLHTHTHLPTHTQAHPHVHKYTNNPSSSTRTGSNSNVACVTLAVLPQTGCTI